MFHSSNFAKNSFNLASKSTQNIIFTVSLHKFSNYILILEGRINIYEIKN